MGGCGSHVNQSIQGFSLVSRRLDSTAYQCRASEPQPSLLASARHRSGSGVPRSPRAVSACKSGAHQDAVTSGGRQSQGDRPPLGQQSLAPHAVGPVLSRFVPGQQSLTPDQGVGTVGQLRGSPRRSGEGDRVTSAEDDSGTKTRPARHGPRAAIRPQRAVSSSITGSGHCLIGDRNGDVPSMSSCG